jgi:SAM-dependent methyltransferase
MGTTPTLLIRVGTTLHARLRAALFAALYRSRVLYWLASTIPFAGQWRVWQQLALPRLRGHAILEIGCGTGDLLADMAAASYACAGLDRSPRMIAATRATLRRRHQQAQLYLAPAQQLPFAAASFDTAVSSFPSDYIYDPAVLREIGRVLRPGGRLIVIEGAYLLPATLWQRLLIGLHFLVYGPAVLRSPAQPDAELPGMAIPLEVAGLARHSERVATRRWVAFLTIGDKPLAT